MSDKNVSLVNKRKIDHILNVLGRGLFLHQRNTKEAEAKHHYDANENVIKQKV